MSNKELTNKPSTASKLQSRVDKMVEKEGGEVVQWKKFREMWGNYKA